MIFMAFAHNWAPAASLQATATRGRFNGRRSLRPRYAIVARALAAALLLSWHATAATAATLTWNTTTGDWNTTATNWDNAGTPEAWSQTSATAASNAAVFAGTDGTYTVTTSGTVNAQSVTFNNSGYTVTGTALTLRPTSSTSGTITVAANKTATISSAITYSNNANAAITVNSGATLNLGGGASNSQYRFAGAGTVNMTAGAYTANVGYVNTATFNQSGGTFNMTLPSGTGGGYSIGNIAGQSVTYTLSGTGTINANASADGNTNSFLAIGRAAANAAYNSTLGVQGNASLNVGTTANRSGELHIASTADSNGTLNVTGGTVTVGTSKADNKIYFFKAGSNPGYTAGMTQSAGTVTTNGIQFGGTTGTYDGTSAATLTLSGGSLYIGAQGITRGSAAADLPITIQLTGGTLGAAANWVSSMDMQLGTAGGGVTVQAANSGGTAANITLSGILSGSGSLVKTGSGTLSLSGANTYGGNTTINTGTLALGASGSFGNSASIVVASGATFDVSAVTSGFTLGAAQVLNGAGTVSGSTTANGTLSPGLTGAVGTMSFLNNLSLGSGSILSYQLNGGDTTVGGAVNDLSSISGNFTLDGTLNVAESVANSFLSATAGNSWRLFNYSGTLTDNTLSLGTMPTLGSGLTFGIDTGTAGQVNLVVNTVPEPATIVTGLFGLGLTGLAAARRRRCR